MLNILRALDTQIADEGVSPFVDTEGAAPARSRAYRQGPRAIVTTTSPHGHEPRRGLSLEEWDHLASVAPASIAQESSADMNPRRSSGPRRAVKRTLFVVFFLFILYYV
ncbi:MAG: hypothetical protein ABIP03_05905, partial [Aquihabitans sp.]